MTGDNGAVTGFMGLCLQWNLPGECYFGRRFQINRNERCGEKTSNWGAEFVRAFWHFYLVNLFGDVPL